MPRPATLRFHEPATRLAWASRLPHVAAVLLCAWIGSGTLAALALTRRWTSPVSEPTPADFEALRLRTADGLSLGAWLGEVEHERGAIVLVHGNGSSRSALLDEARSLRALGFSVLPITVRAHGDSEGHRNDFGWSAREDVATAARYLESHRPASLAGGRTIVVMGISLGAAASVFAAPALGARVRGYVLVGPYADLHLATSRRTERYLPPLVGELAYGALLVGGRMVLPELDLISPATSARGMPKDVPTLVLVGERDDRAPLSDARLITAPLTGARIEVIAGASHEEVSASVSTEAGLAIVARFLDELASRQGGSMLSSVHPRRGWRSPRTTPRSRSERARARARRASRRAPPRGR